MRGGGGPKSPYYVILLHFHKEAPLYLLRRWTSGGRRCPHGRRWKYDSHSLLNGILTVVKHNLKARCEVDMNPG